MFLRFFAGGLKYSRPPVCCFATCCFSHMISSFLLFDIAILAYTFGVHKQLRGQEAPYKNSSVNGTSERVGSTCGKSGSQTHGKVIFALKWAENQVLWVSAKKESSQTLALEKRRVWGEEFVL